MSVTNIDTYRLHKLDETNKEAHQGIVGLIEQIQKIMPTTFNSVALSVYRCWLELKVEQRRKLFLDVNISEGTMRLFDASRMSLGTATEPELVVTITSAAVSTRLPPGSHDERGVEILSKTPPVLGALTTIILTLHRLCNDFLINIATVDGRQFMHIEHDFNPDRVTIEIHAKTMDTIVKEMVAQFSLHNS